MYICIKHYQEENKIIPLVLEKIYSIQKTFWVRKHSFETSALQPNGITIEQLKC